MLSDRLEKSMNEQINAEFASAYQYLGMAAYFQSVNLEGSAHWMRRQAGEEAGRLLSRHGGRAGASERAGQVRLSHGRTFAPSARAGEARSSPRS